MRTDSLVLVRGAGDLGTGVAHRLFRAGYRVVALEVDEPSVVRRAASFADAIFRGETSVEGVTARRVTLDGISQTVGGSGEDIGRPESETPWGRFLPVVVDPEGGAIERLRPDAIIDARMAKRNLGTARDDAEVTIGLGPGFEAGRDVDFVVETSRGNLLGRVIESGAALRNTGVPGVVAGVGSQRLLRSPCAGTFRAVKSIGDLVDDGEIIGTVSGEPVKARTTGLLRGLIADGVRVPERGKVGDVDPRGAAIDPAGISDKARAIGGAVLEALLSRGILPGGARREERPDPRHESKREAGANDVRT
jgi:xanthine dehydrogenase accessory factor